MSKSEEKTFVRYKFNRLFTYCDTEWLGDSKKKYRRVFNRHEISYLYAEFSFFNKLFDEEDWTCNIKMVCFSSTGGRRDATREQICEIKVDRKVLKDENIAYVREGWGNKEQGTFWKKGNYEWVVFIDEVQVASQVFYVEDEEPVTDTKNPFFSIESVKLFEADFTEPAKENKVYYNVFDGEATRYVWGELNMINKIGHDFQAEIIFNFYNDEGQFKGSNSECFLFSGDKREVSMGWGASNRGTWYNNKYTLEILFMNTLIAVVPFEVGDEFIEGEVQVFKSKAIGEGSRLDAKEPDATESLDELLLQMDTLIGMDNVKQKIKDYVKYLNFIKLRKEKGFEENEKMSLHAVLTGNPGTGKTTIARQLGKIYKAMGLLSKGHVTEVDRADLVAEYIGQTAPKVKKVIEKARGGILFIDEAYALHRGDDDNRDFGREVIEIIIKEMSDGKGDLAVIVAGYPKEMNAFLGSNPGMKSRFNQYFHFDDYIPEELMAIADLGFKNKGLQITEEAHKFLFQKLTNAYRSRDRTFGNARFAMSVVDEAKINMGLRLMKNEDMSALPQEAWTTVAIEDVERIFLAKSSKNLDIQIDNGLLHDAMAELNSLIGMESVKNEINEQVKLVKYYREIGKDVLNKFTLHSVFTGSPGTGKTTVARIYAKICRALGVIEKGHLVECDRENLVAGYSGQTAIKTAAIIDQAMGGILFIDEAYSLQIGPHDEFGKEAINTLLKRMEDNREDFIVIAAGYTGNMADFLATNPGLKSRFERVIEFPDYTPVQLLEIANKMLSDEGLKADAAAADHLTTFLTAAYDRRDKFFGNARDVRKLVLEAAKNQNLRMASMDPSHRTREMIGTLTLEDVAEFTVESLEGKAAAGKVGFKFGGK